MIFRIFFKVNVCHVNINIIGCIDFEVYDWVRYRHRNERIKKLINGMSVSSGGRKNRIGTSEGKSASVEVDSKGRGRRGHGKVSPETLPASKSVFDLSEGFSASHRSNKWKLRKSVSA